MLGRPNTYPVINHAKHGREEHRCNRCSPWLPLTSHDVVVAHGVPSKVSCVVSSKRLLHASFAPWLPVRSHSRRLEASLLLPTHHPHLWYTFKLAAWC